MARTRDRVNPLDVRSGSIRARAPGVRSLANARTLSWAVDDRFQADLAETFEPRRVRTYAAGEA